MAKRKVFITGASSGFGKMAVSLLLEKGHEVIAGMRGGQRRLEDLFAFELRQYRGCLSGIDLHLERPETFTQAKQLIDEKWNGGLDVLVNNAGYGLFGALEDTTPEQLRHQMEVNFFGPMLLTRALLPSLRAARGRILNVSSVGGRITLPLYTSYSASKFALEGATEGLYYELKPFGVQVCLIEPGGFSTEFVTHGKILAEGGMDPASPYYRRSQATISTVEKSGRYLPGPGAVARVIARYSEKNRIPLRRVVGLDGRAVLILKWLLPESWWVWILDFSFRKVAYKE